MSKCRRPLAAAALLAAFAAGGTACGVPVSGAPQVVQDVPAGLMQPPTTTHIRPQRPPKGVFNIYLVTGNQLFEVYRAGAPTPQRLLTALDSGPNNFELAEGLTTDMPPGAHVTIVKIHGHIATVNLETSGDAFGSLLGVAQIVWTVTLLKGVTEVAFFQAGAPVTAPNEDGHYYARPLSRSDFARYGPGGVPQPNASTSQGKATTTTQPNCSLAVGQGCH